MSYAFDEPVVVRLMPETQRVRRCRLREETCVVDQAHFFVRACLELPVRDGPGPFVWGVWVSLSEPNFRRFTRKLHFRREKDAPAFGWLSSALPGYEEPTLNLKTMVHQRRRGLRPLVVLEPSDHRIAREQRDGIEKARVQEFARIVLHGE